METLEMRATALFIVLIASISASLSPSRYSKCPVSNCTSKNIKNCEKECKLGPSPLVFEENDKYKLDYLTRFRWEIYSPRYNWFYDPIISLQADNPCQTFKLAYSGIDVTLFAPDCPIPICSTLKCTRDFQKFVVNNTQICEGLKTEMYDISCRRVSYGLNLVSACGKIRTVILSKAIDEFPLGYNYRLVENPKWRKPNCNAINKKF